MKNPRDSANCPGAVVNPVEGINMDEHTETYLCAGCSTPVTRPIARGQRPKWCPPCRTQRDYIDITCEHCRQPGRTWRKGRFCSIKCSDAAKVKPKPEPTPPRDMRSPIRKAYEEANWHGLLSAIKSDCDVTDGCWLWQRRLDDGYPVVSIAGKRHQVHRLTLQAMNNGLSLGTQHAHHKCATPACVRPDHLQPVTHRENVAEMLARNSYVARVRELEDALRLVDPQNAALLVIPVL